MEFLVQRDIERRVKKEIGATDYFSETVVVRITSAKTTISTENAIFVLANDKIDIPVYARLVIASPDNLLSTSKTEFEGYELHKFQSFRNHISVSLSNYGDTFVPFTLEFIKVIPTL